jgi:hypothetical protein
MVEVHWRLDIDEQEGFSNYAATLPVKDLWARAVPWSVAGQKRSMPCCTCAATPWSSTGRTCSYQLSAISGQRSGVRGQGSGHAPGAPAPLPVAPLSAPRRHGRRLWRAANSRHTCMAASGNLTRGQALPVAAQRPAAALRPRHLGRAARRSGVAGGVGARGVAGAVAAGMRG